MKALNAQMEQRRGGAEIATAPGRRIRRRMKGKRLKMDQRRVDKVEVGGKAEGATRVEAWARAEGAVRDPLIAAFAQGAVRRCLTLAASPASSRTARSAELP